MKTKLHIYYICMGGLRSSPCMFFGLVQLFFGLPAVLIPSLCCGALISEDFTLLFLVCTPFF